MAEFYATVQDANVECETILADDSGPLDLTGSVITFMAHPAHSGGPDITGGAVWNPDQVTFKGSVKYILTGPQLSGALPDTYRVRWKVVQAGSTALFPDPGTDTLYLSAAV